MKLKKLGILFTVIVSLSIVGYTSRNDDNDVVHMKLAHNMSEDHPIHKSLSEFEKLVEEKSKGTIDVEIYPNGVLGSEREMIELTQVEFQIIEYFFKNPNAALSRTDILKTVWGANYFGDEKIVDVNIRRLRMKIEDNPSSPTRLVTIWGLGYKWITDNQ